MSPAMRYRIFMSMLHQALAQNQQARTGKKKDTTNEEIDDISHKLST